MFLSASLKAMRLRCFVLSALSLWIGFLAATLPSVAATDFLIDVNDTGDGLPSSTVTSIAQTPDGYLWIGTYNGLARFDGERFVTYDSVETPELSHARIQGLYVDAGGTLWINTFRGGLTSYRNGRFHREWKDHERLFDLHTTLAHSTSNEVFFVMQFGDVLHGVRNQDGLVWKVIPSPGGSRPLLQCADPLGRLWFTSRDGRVLLFHRGEFREFSVEGFPTDRRATAISADQAGNIYFGFEGAIVRWDGTRAETISPSGPEAVSPQWIIPTRRGDLWVLDGDRFRKLLNGEWVDEVQEWRGRLGYASGRAMGVHEDRASGLWMNHYGNGLFHITPDGRYERFTTSEGLPGDRLNAWFQSREGNIWVGVDRGGLVRMRERRFHVVGQSEGLPARGALSVCEDPAGTIWIGTGGGGLIRLQDENVRWFQVGNHVAANFVFSIFPRSDGGVWLSAAEGEDLYAFRNDQIQRAPWEVHGVKSILSDRAGRVWMGTKSGLSWWTLVDRRVFGTNEGVALSAVRALAEAPDGAIWAGGDFGSLYRCEPDRVQSFRPDDPLADQPIWSILVDNNSTVWCGTFRGGLLRFKNGKFSRITHKQGLPADAISQLLEDDHGRIWMGTPQGICSISKKALEDCADGKLSRVDSITYGRLDGLPTLECSDGYQPSCWKSRDGRLWFTTVKGAVFIDPNQIRTNAVPVPVLIEELWVDGEQMPLDSGKIRIPPGRKRYEFRFTALSFEATRFRYRIEPFDTDWTDAGTRRTVQYSQLPAGEYQFRVIASDNKGVWSESGAALPFSVEPYFYERRSFRFLAIVLILGAVAIAVRSVASRKYRRKLARLEQQHAIERDRARIAKDIHDDIGAGLTQITLLSELARREKDQTPAMLDRISSSARELTRAMDEIVWAVDPQHDTFAGLLDYISAFTEDYLRVAGIRCRMDLPVTPPQVQVDAELRYNLFLALKETLNNIVKHARATEVWLRVQLEQDRFSLIVEDNGKGLNSPDGTASEKGGDRLSSGSGLNNLEERLQSIGGTCRIESRPGQGTRVEMTVTVSTLPNG